LNLFFLSKHHFIQNLIVLLKQMITNPDLCAEFLSSSTQLLIDLRIELAQHVKITKTDQPLGSFAFQLQPSPKAITVVAQNPGANPVLSFPLSKKTDLSFTSQTSWSIFDANRKQWVLNFRDARDSFHVLSAMALISGVTDPSKPTTWDPPGQPFSQAGRAVAANDTVNFSYHCFSVPTFPYIDKWLANATIPHRKITPPKNGGTIVEHMAGMFPAQTRVFFTPNLTEPDLPGGPVVVVIELLRVKFASGGGTAAEDDSPAPAETAAEPAAEPKKPAEHFSIFDDPPPSRKVDDVPSVPAPRKVFDDVPSVPAPRKVDDVPAPRKAEESSVREFVQREVSETQRALLERLAALESLVDERLAAVEKPPGEVEGDAVLNGLQGLATQLQVKSDLANRLQKELAEAKGKNSARRELEEEQRRGAMLEQKMAESARKATELQEAIDGLGERVKGPAVAIVKKLMSDVFEEMGNEFDDASTFLGSVIADNLRRLLLLHSNRAFATIKTTLT
jgi:hypothetical protein